MPNIDVKKYNLDSAMELVADQYQAELPGSALLRGSTTADRIFLQSGLLSGTGGQVTMASISNGIIDEYETTIRPSEITTRIRGRDASFLVLDTYVRRIFKRQPISVPLQVTIGQPFRPPPPDNLSHVPYVLTPPNYPGAPTILAGIFNASQIASIICADVGLTLSWGCRDYELREDFSAVGRVADVLRRLIEPWTLVEPFRADLFFRGGNTVIIQPRSFPIQGTDYQLALSDLRRSEATIRKRRTKLVGILTLNGQKISAAQTNPNATGIFSIFLQGEQVEEDTIETFNPPGVLKSIVHTVRTYGMPAHNLLLEVKQTFSFAAGAPPQLTARETIRNEWDDVVVDLSGARSQPKQQNSTKTIERIDDSDPNLIFRLWDIEEIGYSYDDSTFQNGETMQRRTFSLDDNAFHYKVQIIKTQRDKGSLTSEQITEQYTFDETNQKWVIQSRDTQTGAGRRAGGPGRGLPVKRQGFQGQSRTGGATQIQVISLLAVDPTAVDVTYSNVNLTIADLNFILAQFLAAQGLLEYEVSFMGPAQVWLQRGTTVQLTSVVAEDGSQITLPPLLITESKMDYDESSATPKVTSVVRGFGWQKT